MSKGKKSARSTVKSNDKDKLPEQQQQQIPLVTGENSVSYSLPQHNRQAAFSLLYLFVFSVAMFTLPFAAFYGVQNYLTNHMDVTSFQRTFYSVLASVLMVNLIICLYAVVAYRETEYDEQGNVIDQSKLPPPPPPMANKTELNKKVE